jgi:hypothetical protein
MGNKEYDKCGKVVNQNLAYCHGDQLEQIYGILEKVK